jgi:hypothetical protein
MFKELIQLFPKYCKKIKEDGILSNSFYKASITPIPKPDKDTMKK